MKLYDMIKKEFVRCDKDGRLDGTPVFTAKICRVIRNWTPAVIAETYDISMELAREWKDKSKKIFLIMFDSKGSYKHIEDTGFEDEAGMERRAERYIFRPSVLPGSRVCMRKDSIDARRSVN